MGTTATDGRPEESRIVTASAAGTGRRRAQRLGPLVHELLAWDFVREAESGVFVLSEDVQERLRAVANAHPPSRPSVFVGRPCERCGAVGHLTRLVDGQRLCPLCQLPDDAAEFADPELSPLPPHRHWSWRRRKAS